jgi:hypothetical protein
MKGIAKRSFVMPVSRRTFLGTVAGACLGLQSRACADLVSWNRGRVDRAEQSFVEQSEPAADEGYLDQSSTSIDEETRSPQSPYRPQAGDIVFSRSKYWIYRAGHRIAGAGEPSHSAIVWQRPNGAFAILEAGPFDVPIIRSLDLVSHLRAYHGRGHVWVRPRTQPLTENQTARLAAFAAKQENKPFARMRLVGQITPFRSRGYWRTEVMGQSQGADRFSYFCAELVVESLIAIGEIRAENARPSATYPSDLFTDVSDVPFLNERFKLAPKWSPPQRWRPCLVPLID